jgi:hypothetical protein
MTPRRRTAVAAGRNLAAIALRGVLGLAVAALVLTVVHDTVALDPAGRTDLARIGHRGPVAIGVAAGEAVPGVVRSVRVDRTRVGPAVLAGAVVLLFAGVTGVPGRRGARPVSRRRPQPVGRGPPQSRRT